MLFCSLFLLSSHPLTSLVHVSSEYLETRQGQDKVGILYYAHYDSPRSKCRFKSAQPEEPLKQKWTHLLISSHLSFCPLLDCLFLFLYSISSCVFSAGAKKRKKNPSTREERNCQRNTSLSRSAHLLLSLCFVTLFDLCVGNTRFIPVSMNSNGQPPLLLMNSNILLPTVTV